MKELAGYLSVFLIIIINSLVNFYTPVEKEYIEKSFINRNLEDFLENTLMDINSIYTLPILFSISTITMYIFEKWDHAHSDVRRIRNRVNNIQVPITPTMQRCDSIVNDIRKIVEQSRELANK